MSDLTVDIWSDVTCPWCYIGKRKFEVGLAEFSQSNPDAAAAVTFHSYQLDPGAPEIFTGTNTEYFEAKGFPVDQIGPMQERVAEIAAAIGLDYRLDQVKHVNTRKAHEQLHFARQHGRQVELKERLLAAHFIEGSDLGRDEDLADLAAEVGLDRDAALAALQSRRYGAAVEADLRLGQEYGITGVPFFVINDKYGISGAQEAATFTAALTQIYADAMVGDEDANHA